MEFLKAIAPTVAAALAGPGAALAVEAIGRAFNWSDATKEKIEKVMQGPMSSEDLARIQLAELDLQAKEKELGFRFAELASKERIDTHRTQQETIKTGDTAEDVYVRHTRPMMARQSWYGMGIYILAMEVWRAIDPNTQGANWELALIIGAPGLAYMGFRSVFDKFGLGERVAGVFRKGASK